jgi:energy-coupling factor transporter ATP-binding protein EcfA2
MTYDFKNLSYTDFEDLVRDLLGRELSVRFEAFCVGPDGGMDGRHAAASGTIILQAKHHASSRFSSLKTVMAKERSSIDKLRPSRYILATSRPLSPFNKSALARIIGPALKSDGDIFGPEDLNGLLRKFPDIEKANIKLWLASTAVLERVLNAASYALTAVTRDEIEAKLKIYAPNPSFQEARDKLESEHVVIIAGPPGVGKTTLAEMLSYAYIAESWEYVRINGIDNALLPLSDAKRQIFFFDDFLGRASLDYHALAAHDSDIARFIRRIRMSKNARFLLTTRAPVFEEARRASERLADPSLDITKYLLDVGVYTRRIKARILYNHLLVSGLSRAHIIALWNAAAVPKIVDHKNYNPRIIEAMTEGVQVKGISPRNYPAEFLHALDHPNQIWDTAFRKHIPPMCRHLLYCLFFFSEYGADLDELRPAFNALHGFLAKKYAIPLEPKDFEESLRILEGGFIGIRSGEVSFINPSIRDYLVSYLDDADMLADFAVTAQKAEWAQKLWQHTCHEDRFSSNERKKVALNLLPVAKRFVGLPVMKRSATDSNTLYFDDLTNAARLGMLLELYRASRDKKFIQIAHSLVTRPVGGFTPWRDGPGLIKIVRILNRDTLHFQKTPDSLIDEIEEKLAEMLNGHIWPDDLEAMDEAFGKDVSDFGSDVRSALNRAIIREVNDIDNLIADVDSESTLQDHISAIERFGPRVGVSPEKIERAVARINDRISSLEVEPDSNAPQQFSSAAYAEPEQFDDTALLNLFAPLVSGAE